MILNIETEQAFQQTPRRRHLFIGVVTGAAEIGVLSGSSHKVYKTPWRGDPRINIQNSKGKAKAYQVKQVLKAIERLEVENGNKK